MIPSNPVIASALNSVALCNNKNTQEYLKFSLHVELKPLSNHKRTISTLEAELILNLLLKKNSHCDGKLLVQINMRFSKEGEKAACKICRRFRSVSWLTTYALVHLVLKQSLEINKVFLRVWTSSSHLSALAVSIQNVPFSPPPLLSWFKPRRQQSTMKPLAPLPPPPPPPAASPRWDEEEKI